MGRIFKKNQDLIISTFLFAIFTGWTISHRGKHDILNVLDGSHSTIYSTLATVDGALLGFMITASSIILGHLANDKFSDFKKDIHYMTFWHTVTSSIKLLGLNTCISVIALIFDRNLHPEIFITDIVFGLTLLTIWRLFKAMKLMKLLLDIELIQSN